MTSEKKFIGVVGTKLTSEQRKEYLVQLNHVAAARGYKVVFFTDPNTDFSDMPMPGTGELLRHIPMELLCALVILPYSDADISVIGDLKNRALQQNVPVVMVRHIEPGCYCLVGHYEEAYIELLRTIFQEHNITDPFFIGGGRGRDLESLGRYNCYRAILAEFNLEERPDRIDYGEYGEYATHQIIEKLVFGEEPLPQVFVCASDAMAVAAIEALKENGIRVPQDTLVVGFNGEECARYSEVMLSTCYEDVPEMARLTIDVVDGAGSDRMPPDIYFYNYQPIFAESTGAQLPAQVLKKDSSVIYKMYRTEENDEEYCSEWLDTMLMEPNLASLSERITDFLLAGSRLIVRAMNNRDDLKDKEALEHFPGAMRSITKSKEGISSEHTVGPVSGLREALLEKKDDPGVILVSAIAVPHVNYGYLVGYIDDVRNRISVFQRHIRTLRRALLASVSGEWQIHIQEQLNRAVYYDILTDMPNRGGLERWFYSMKADGSAEKTSLAIGVYSFCNSEKYMKSNTPEAYDEAIQFLAGTLKITFADAEVIGRISVDTFAVFTMIERGACEETKARQSQKIMELVELKNRFVQADSLIEVSCGYVEADPGWAGPMDNYLGSAEADLYRNRLEQQQNIPAALGGDQLKLLDYQRRLRTLLSENLFSYAYQPIVDAHTGEIVAYEALMRTAEIVKLNPLEVLEAAKVYSKLGAIEHATFFNILRTYSEDRELFDGRSVFINTIPGHFLSNEEIEEIRTLYGDILEHVVVELTETETAEDSELRAIRSLGGAEHPTRIAVDDYGTGHSNIVSLLKYRPQIVKIDRYLITDIHLDKDKQMFVKNLLVFTGDNNIKVLAEGVETREEMEYMISIGVDLIQGYYTARPSFELIQKLPDEIREAILEANRKCGL